MKKLYILNVGSTHDKLKQKYGDFDKWARDKIDDKIPTKTLHVKKDSFPKTDKCLGVIVMGSHAMVSDEKKWMKKTSKFLKKCLKSKIPILGICFGHQLLAYTLGAKISFNQNGLEIGTRKVKLSKKGKKDKLFLGFKKSFNAHTSHFQSVITFPKGLSILAFNTHEKNHAFRYGKNAYGVQFHPEFTKKIMQFYTKNHSEDLGSKYQDIYNQISNCKQSHKILTNFTKLVLNSP